MTRLSQCLLAVVACLCVTNFQLSAEEPIVAQDAKLEKLFTGIVLTEGVAVAPDGMVYFSDITFSHQAVDDKGVIQAGHIWKFDPQDRQDDDLPFAQRHVQRHQVRCRGETC